MQLQLGYTLPVSLRIFFVEHFDGEMHIFLRKDVFDEDLDRHG